MKIKCTAIYSNSHPKKNLGAQARSLSVGKEYIVLSLRIANDMILYEFEDDEGDYTGFDSSQFTMISQYIPSSWVANLKNDSNNYVFDMAPKSWYDAKFQLGQDFWEAICDADGPLENWRDYPADQIPDAVKLYLQETEIIYLEEKEHELKNRIAEKIEARKIFNIVDFRD